AALKVLHGPERIGRLYYCVARYFSGLGSRIVKVSGELGAIITLDGKLFSVVQFAFRGDRICGIYNMRNPEKLTHAALGDASELGGRSGGMGEKGELDGGAAGLVLARPQAPAMRVDDRAADRQPHSQAGGLRGVEGGESTLGGVWREAGARI